MLLIGGALAGDGGAGVERGGKWAGIELRPHAVRLATGSEKRTDVGPEDYTRDNRPY